MSVGANESTRVVVHARCFACAVQHLSTRAQMQAAQPRSIPGYRHEENDAATAVQPRTALQRLAEIREPGRVQTKIASEIAVQFNAEAGPRP